MKYKGFRFQPGSGHSVVHEKENSPSLSLFLSRTGCPSPFGALFARPLHPATHTTDPYAPFAARPSFRFPAFSIELAQESNAFALICKSASVADWAAPIDVFQNSIHRA